MDFELAETLKLIIDRYGERKQGSVFIPMRDFPWYNEWNGHLTCLYEEGLIAKPRFYDNGADITLTRAGRRFLTEKHWLLFPDRNSAVPCPVCGYPAKVLSTDAAHSWAELDCENCSTYALKADALDEAQESELPLLSGYYRHAYHAPLTIPCDDKESIRDHISSTRSMVTRDYQMSQLLRHYYQKMRSFDDFVTIDNFPAITYSSDEADLMELVDEAVKKGYAVLKNGNIAVTRQGKEWLDAKSDKINRMGANEIMKNEIFISHRTTDAPVADMIKDFLVGSGIPNEMIFCTSLPGNDVSEKIGLEVKRHLQKAAIVVLILSRDYYQSAYCLNEAGVAWYLDDISVIPIGLPEINHNNMIGFLNSEYKLRRLNDDADIAHLYDKAHVLNRDSNVLHSVITQETKKLKEKYQKYIAERQNGKEDDEKDNDDIWEDGYHEVKSSSGEILKKGQFIKGSLVDGIEYNIILKVAKGDENNEEPVLYAELNEENWYYSEYGQYEGIFFLILRYSEIVDTGLQFFYVVDKKVTIEGKKVKPTFMNFRPLENFLEQKEPDELEYIKTGVRKYEETGYADIEI